MDDSRTQAYLTLIRMLLDYPTQVNEILNANQELIDGGLVHTMRQVVEQLTTQGYESTAEFLKDIAEQLATQTGAVTFTICIDFLLEVLSLTERSNGNQEEVYSFLVGKEDQLNIDFMYTLKVYADKYLKNQELERQLGIVAIISAFSRLIQKFPLGNRAINQEIALTGNQIALTVYSRKDFPKDWVRILNNLAVVYTERIHGSKIENIEMAKECCEAALEVCSRTVYSESWAAIQMNLGLAYLYRIKESEAENIEKAIECYKAASEVYPRERDDYEWARIQHNLGDIYKDRLRGEKADNLETAIEYYLAALKVRIAFLTKMRYNNSSV
ncbi:tetratricopeptide repeat protein [Lyngbya sp. CCAP 1446/10]|uniref:tetratricopeptide repeat protein n=1 Tax=Lyngbya sp. CCAP 1446/10 TaxID=439293 RepID=UPI002238AA61|nr:tetratricopeptide repeat protein [Lyngbya sp. CCAP 1446/10]MCW6053411.1 tetratricopeptide repeat protein [Lyngbya sp. CCAP 1446/10]